MDSAGKTVVHGSQGTERDWFLVPALQLTPCVVCFWGVVSCAAPVWLVIVRFHLEILSLVFILQQLKITLIYHYKGGLSVWLLFLVI